MKVDNSFCTGESTKTESCDCPYWGEWGDWQQCSVVCLISPDDAEPEDYGHKIRERICENETIEKQCSKIDGRKIDDVLCTEIVDGITACETFLDEIFEEDDVVKNIFIDFKVRTFEICFKKYCLILFISRNHIIFPTKVPNSSK